ncbi:MAG: DUF1338 domain-containing protein [Kofleriaceae bacterium]
MTPTELLAHLWDDYVAKAPQALRIHHLLEARGERVQNDHLALRGLALPGLDVAALARPFEAAGWQPRERYRFEEKRLAARYWQHPDPALPKVFISELLLDELSAPTRALLTELAAQVPAGFGGDGDLPWAGRPWRLTYGVYEQLLEESEYAAWVAAFGFGANHFTVDVGALTTFASLEALNAFLTGEGFALNPAGGLIKGSPAELLEQSSTLAEVRDVSFEDRHARVPTCYYEFARRYPLPSGELFHGFVPASADRIFESTDVAQARARDAQAPR